VWCFNTPEAQLPELERVEMPHKLHWKDELDSPGAWQMQIARSLFLSRPFLSRKPAQSVLLDVRRGQRALQGEGFLYVYSPRGDEIGVDVRQLPWTEHACWWFDPRTGASHRTALQAKEGKARISPPGRPYRGNDWVLVIDDASKAYLSPGTVSP
jgi:hypothetical protein